MLTAALDGLVARFGLAALFGLADKIALGQIDAGVSGGVDSASDAPVTVSEPLRRSLLRAAAGRSTAAKAKALAGIRPTHLGIATPTNGEPRTGLSMGSTWRSRHASGASAGRTRTPWPPRVTSGWLRPTSAGSSTI